MDRNAAMLLMLVGATIFLISFAIPVNAQGQVVLNPIDDTFTAFDSPQSSFGNLSYLSIRYIEFRNVWLKFDLSPVPDGAILDSAVLELYAVAVPEAFNISAHQCFNNSWSEHSLTYEKEWPFISSGFNSTSMNQTLVAVSSQWYSWNVIDAAANATDGVFGGEDMMTIVLIDWYHYQIEEVYAEFSSKEAGVNIPKLTIHWSGIIPEYPSLPIASLFAATMALALTLLGKRARSRILRETF